MQSASSYGIAPLKWVDSDFANAFAQGPREVKRSHDTAPIKLRICTAIHGSERPRVASCPQRDQRRTPLAAAYQQVDCEVEWANLCEMGRISLVWLIVMSEERIALALSRIDAALTRVEMAGEKAAENAGSGVKLSLIHISEPTRPY